MNTPPSSSNRIAFCSEGMIKTRSVSPLRVYPPAYLGFEYFERDRAVLENLVVEFRDAELRPEGLLGAFAELYQLELTDLVRQRLARDCGESLGFRHGAGRLRGRVRHHVVERLLARPAL